MNKTQKEEKRKKVRKTYLKFKERNLIPKRKAAELQKLKLEKEEKEAQEEFMTLLSSIKTIT